MKIVIASTCVPFIKGGGTAIVGDLEAVLKERKFQVDTVLIPVYSYWPDLPEQTLAIRALDLSECAGNKIDLLITIRTPAYALPHPNKVAWFIHHHREAYDLWGTPYGSMSQHPSGARIRELMLHSDARFLRECKKICTNSKIVAGRLKKFNHIDADEVLYPPLLCPEIFHNDGFGDYFLYASRVNGIKRQALAIQAMKYVKSPFKLIIAGKADADYYWAELQTFIRLHDLEDRVKLLGRVSEEEKADLMANAYAALYLPYDEDSYGYVTLEAFHSSKPVITLSDSGGPAEIIEDGFNGLIVEPTPEALALAMERLWADKTRTILMGRNACETIRLHNISWDHVIEALVA